MSLSIMCPEPIRVAFLTRCTSLASARAAGTESRFRCIKRDALTPLNLFCMFCDQIERETVWPRTHKWKHCSTVALAMASNRRQTSQTICTTIRKLISCLKIPIIFLFARFSRTASIGCLLPSVRRGALLLISLNLESEADWQDLKSVKVII